uniref:Nephrin n=1 Tax=Parascaris univalens TaxID=6257 RepID=A0A915BAH0_PARUN
MLIAPLIVLICIGASSAHDPLFREEPKNQTVLLGHDVILRCVAEPSQSGETLRSQWKSSDGSLLGFRDEGVLAGYRGRYSYLRDGPDEKHLRIESVTLDDDGMFECQMMRPGIRGFRSSAYLTVVVPPSEMMLLNYRAGEVIQVNEGTTLNISCGATNAKPAVVLNWYVNGKVTTEGVHRWSKHNLNRTVTSYAALLWKPSRIDHKTVLTCEASHPPSEHHYRVNISLDVLYPSNAPRISIISGSSSAQAGDNVTMVCSTSGGNPPPNVTWFLNDRAIGTNFYYDYSTQETRNVYSMIVEADDNGAVYECRSRNRIGSEPLKDSIRLSIAYAPLGVDVHGESATRYGRPVLVHCRSRLSNPASRIKWLINGQPVRSSDESQHEQPSGTITISNLTINPSDTIVNRHHINVECIAENERGRSSKQHTIRILAPPMEPRIYGMDGEALLEGEMLNLTCEAHGGNPLATLSWFRGVDKLKETRSTASGDTSQSTVSFILDRTMNNQQVRCEAENGALDEPLVATKTITVLFPPRRVVVRQDERTRRQMIAGEPTQLICIVPSSNPAAEISWQFSSSDHPVTLRGENKLNKTSRENGGFEVENVLEFTPTLDMDGSDVKCIASHPLWSDQKVTPFPLNIFYAPQMTVDGPVTIVVDEGDSFKENLTVRANPAIATWKWRKNGIPFENTVGAIFARGAVLSGRSVSGFDSGLYTLIAANSIGSVNVSLRLTVKYAARVTHITSPVMAASGEEVVMECEVDGVPRINGMVKWLRGDTVIDTVSFDGQTRAVLRLNASQETSGAYTCVADNGVGKPNRTTAYLLVSRAPSITRHASLLRAAGPLGGRARLRCRAHAVPDATFHWSIQSDSGPIRYNNTKYSFYEVQLDHSTFESVLWISGLDQLDYQRTVKCVAMNRLGEDVVQITVGPPTAPDVPVDLRVANSSRSSLTLVWVPGFDGGSEQVFQVRYQIPGENVYHTINSTSPKVEIRGLNVAQLYEVAVRAVNARGAASDYSRPSLSAYTRDENDVDISAVSQKKDSFPRSLMVTFCIGGALLLIINCLLLCYMQRHQRKKKLQEKTEMVRKTNSTGGDVRPVQMYGALTNTESAYRPDSANTNRSELAYEPPSEDDQSVRTMIEVNPNGYVQQVDRSAFYDPECLVEYGFNHVVRQNRLRGDGPTYANMPYPEPPTVDRVSMGTHSVGYPESGTLTRATDVGPLGSSRRIHIPRVIEASTANNYQGGLNNNGASQIMSTFMQPGGVHTAPLDYSHIDGDLV